MATSETSAEVHQVATDASSSPKVSIVVPAFNEAVRIGDSIRKIEAFLDRLPFNTEVLIVDDGSSNDVNTDQYIECLVCRRTHLVSPATGKVVGDYDDRGRALGTEKRSA